LGLVLNKEGNRHRWIKKEKNGEKRLYFKFAS
jgi:hypothetical protein